MDFKETNNIDVINGGGGVNATVNSNYQNSVANV